MDENGGELYFIVETVVAGGEIGNEESLKVVFYFFFLSCPFFYSVL